MAGEAPIPTSLDTEVSVLVVSLDSEHFRLTSKD